MEITKSKLLDILAVIIVGFWLYSYVFKINTVDHSSLDLAAGIALIYLIVF